MSRSTDFMKIVLGEQVDTPEIISRVDTLWNAIINSAASVPITPITPIEKYLANIIDNSIEIPQPQTRLDTIFYAICTGGTLEEITPLSENEELLYEILETGIRENLFDPETAEFYFSLGVESCTTTDNGFIAVRNETDEPAEAGSYNWSSGWINLYCDLQANKQYRIKFDREIVNQKYDFDFPIIAHFGTYQLSDVSIVIEVDSLSTKVHFSEIIEPTEDVGLLTFTMNDCDIEISNLVINEL